MDHFAERRGRLRQVLHEEGVEAFLITHPINVSYLTGFSGDSSFLLLSKDRELLLSDGRYVVQIGEECPGLATHIRTPAQTIVQAAAEVLDKLGLGSIGCESGHLTLADFEHLRNATPALDWKPGKDRVENLRICKDESELEQIRASLRQAEKAFTMFRAYLRPTDEEKDLADALEGFVRRTGAKETAFPPIVAAGPRSALPHAPPSRTVIGDHPLLLVDWGAQGPFYKSDLTRVLWGDNSTSMRGKLAAVDWDRLRKAYEVVLNAQARAIACMRPGVKASEVDAAARATIAAAGFGEFFNHGTGHGFGLQIHETPFLKPGNDTPLQAGMVITVEPGIYLPGVGGVRVEDDVWITPDGHEVLSRLPRGMPDNPLF